MKRQWTGIAAAGLAIAMAITGCGNGQGGQESSTTQTPQSSEQNESTAEQAENVSEAAADGEEIVLKVMHNQPDKTNVNHIYYEDVKERYEEKYPNVKVEFEIYDNTTYKNKLQIYASSHSMPDVFMLWASPAEFYPYAKAGLCAELNPGDFSDYGFIPGAFNNVTMDGKLLGIPRGLDYWYLYVNKGIFDENGIKIPETIDELKTAVVELNQAGVAPIAMNGKDLWNQIIFLNDVMIRYTNGDIQPILDATDMTGSYASVPEFIQAAETMQELVELGIFQSTWISDDEPTCQNLFLQGEAAMWYTGTWCNGIATMESVPQELRDNLTVISFPSVAGMDTSNVLLGREATMLSAAADSEHKEEAINFIKEFYNPEIYPKDSWQKGLGVPMQDFSEFVLDSDPQLLKDVAASISKVKSISSFPFAWRLNPIYLQDCKDATMEMLLGQITAQEYWEKIDASVAENQLE